MSDIEDNNKRVLASAHAQAKRKFVREKLDALYLPNYDKLCGILDDSPEGEFWAPYSGLRTMGEQQKIYNQGRTTAGSIVTNASPGFSPHNWGCASDWLEYHTDYTVSTIWKKSNWVFFAKCVEQAGLRSGKAWSDWPHAELRLKIRWAQVGHFYVANGEAATWEYIKENVFAIEGE